MAEAAPYRIIGIESSPYAVKVRAVCRYRRIPYIWVARMPQFFEETQHVRPLIMPVVQFPDGEYRTDSTPIIEDLERLHPDARSVEPNDPVAAFLAFLIEDMVDEWLTKCVFHYRFDASVDQRAGAGWVVDDTYPGLGKDELDRRVADFIVRQVERKALVGCTPENVPLFESFFREVLSVMEGFVATDRYLFGSRPSIADFALYGQLSTLSVDPTPAAIMRQDAPRTLRWLKRVADASGVEGAWSEPGDPSPAVRALLDLAGRIYLPFLTANAEAIGHGEAAFSVTLDGHDYRQPVFRYQAKCLDVLRHRFASFDGDARARLAPVLEVTECLEALQA